MFFVAVAPPMCHTTTASITTTEFYIYCVSIFICIYYIYIYLYIQCVTKYDDGMVYGQKHELFLAV